jgi:hypothetical protein
MDNWTYINGSKIEKKFFEENLSEAKQLSWKEAAFPLDNDHSHCIICGIAVPSKKNKTEKNYKSDNGWLCEYCFKHFIQ